MLVTRVMEGGSAHNSGEIFPGDVIYSIDDVSCLGWEMSRVCTVRKKCAVVASGGVQSWPNHLLHMLQPWIGVSTLEITCSIHGVGS